MVFAVSSFSNEFIFWDCSSVKKSMFGIVICFSLSVSFEFSYYCCSIRNSLTRSASMISLSQIFNFFPPLGTFLLLQGVSKSSNCYRLISFLAFFPEGCFFSVLCDIAIDMFSSFSSSLIVYHGFSLKNSQILTKDGSISDFWNQIESSEKTSFLSKYR